MNLMQRKMLFLILLLPFVALSSPKVAQAQGPLILTERQGEYKVGQYLAYLEDPSGNLTIEDVTSPKYVAQFRPSAEEIPNFGFTKAAYWVRFEVRNQASSPTLWLLEQAFGNTHRIDLYFPTPDQRGFLVKHAGNTLPFNSREFAYHNPVFKLPLPLNQTQTIYLRAKNSSATFFPLTLWALETFAQARATADLGWGLFAGFLLLMLIHNFLLFFSLRDKACLSLTAFIGSQLFLYLTTYGFAAQYLWPTVGGWDSFAVLFAIGLCLLTGLKFTMDTLSTQTYAPTIHKIFIFLEKLTWLFIGLVPFVKYEDLIKPISAYIVFGCLFAVWTSLRVALRGYRPARYFILGIFFVGIYQAVINLIRFGFLPANNSLEQLYIVVIILQLLLFSLTLLDRVSLLRHEKQQAQAEEATLREQSALFRGMFENHSAVMLLLNPENGQIVEANQAAVAYYGYPLEDLKKLTIHALNQFSPAEVQLEMTRAQAEKRKYFHFPHRLAQGEIRMVEVYSSPVTFKHQDLLFSIVHDITERKQADESLKVSEEHYRLLADNSTDVIWVLNLAGKFTYVSPSVEKLRGYTPQEVLQQTMAEVMTPASLALVTKELELCISNLQDSHKPSGSGIFEIEQPCKDGSTIWTEAGVTLLFDEAGALTGFLGISRDISQRKQAEEALRESEMKFKVMSTSAQDAIIMMDHQGYISFWNEAASRIFGYAPEEVLGQHLHNLLAPSAYLPAHQKKITQFWATGQGQVVGKTVEFEALRKGGEVFPIEVSMSALQIKGGWHALGILRDITERKQLETELQQIVAQQAIILERSVMGIALVRERVMIWANRRFAEMFGYTLAEVTGLPSTVLYRSREDYAQLGQEAYAQLKIGRAYRGEWNLQQKDGTPLWCSMNAKAIDPTNMALGSIWLLEDITELKEQEASLRKYERIVAATTDQIALVARSYACELVNEACSLASGKGKAELVGQPLAEIWGTEAFQTFIKSSFDLCLEGQIVHSQSWLTYEKLGRRFMDVTYAPYLELDNTISGVVMSGRDITDLKEIEQQLQEVNNRFRAELAFARKIQQSLLQPPSPTWLGPKVLCFNMPAREVGGDFYNYLAFPANAQEAKYMFAVGDVTGKGMPAALFMAVSIALLRSVAPQELSPSLLLTNLDKQLESYAKEDRMNCALCYIEVTLPTTGTEGGVARIANGGLIPPFLKPRTGQAELLDVVGPPLGAGFGKFLGYPEKTIELAPGEMLILTSDGLVEAHNLQGEMLGFDRTLALIQAGPNEAEAMLGYLRKEILTFMNEAELHDDITIVVIQL